jgi:hypothetical protein
MSRSSASGNRFFCTTCRDVNRVVVARRSEERGADWRLAAAASDGTPNACSVPPPELQAPPRNGSAAVSAAIGGGVSPPPSDGTPNACNVPLPELQAAAPQRERRRLGGCWRRRLAAAERRDAERVQRATTRAPGPSLSVGVTRMFAFPATGAAASRRRRATGRQTRATCRHPSSRPLPLGRGDKNVRFPQWERRRLGGCWRRRLAAASDGTPNACSVPPPELQAPPSRSG